MTATAWLRGLGIRELTARRRLFVFPHGGGGASAYRLAAYLPDSVEVCIGHSMGSLIAFETARRLRALGTRMPERLFLSGMCAPGLPDRDPRHTLPDDKLLATTEFDGLDVELQELLLPLVRADLTLCPRWRSGQRPARLGCAPRG